MLQIDLFGKILGRSIAAINVCEPTDMGGIVVALSGNLMMGNQLSQRGKRAGNRN